MYIRNKLARLNKAAMVIRAFNRIISYPYGTGVGKVCRTELLEYLNIKRLILMILLIKIKQEIIRHGHRFQIPHTKYY